MLMTSGGWRGYVSLNPHEAATLGAVLDRMFPAGPDHPAATGIGVVTYVDRALAGEDRDRLDDYRRGLWSLDEAARRRAGGPFAGAPGEVQDEIIEALSAGRLPELRAPRPRDFFDLLRHHLQEGLFADPGYGGNAGLAGWRFLGHPGVWLENSAAENLAAEPVVKSEIRSLADAGVVPNPRAVPTRPAGFDPGAGAQPAAGPADVIIVGTGSVGAVIAPILCRAGLRVVAFDAGPWRSGQDYAPDEVGSTHYTRGRMGLKFQNETPRWRTAEGEPTRQATFSLGRMVNGVGGSWLHAGGWLRRFHPHHFEFRSRTLERNGDSVLPEHSTLTDWPLSYEDLEPYYTAVEYLAGVAGDDANPFTPRSRPYPLPPLRPFRAGEVFRTATRDLGLRPFAVPVTTNSEPYNGLPATRYSAWAAGFGPWDNDRWYPALTSIPEALATGNLDLRTECRVIRVLDDGAGRAIGVEYVDPAGTVRRQGARAVILSSYTFENVRLMLLSRSKAHPSGMGNDHGQVGRHFMTRMFDDVFGYFPDTVFNRHTGPASQAMAVEDYLAEGFDSPALGFLGGASMSVENQQLPLQISRAPLPPDVPEWGHRHQEHLRRWQNICSIRVLPEALPYRHHHLDLDPVHRDRSGLGLPLIRITYDLQRNEHRVADWAEGRAEEILRAMGASQTWRGPRFTGVCSCHDLGGCRMGATPEDAVVDTDLAVHDTEGLYVFGGAVFPTAPGLNPTLTIWALAYRAAERLAARLSGAWQDVGAGRDTVKFFPPNSVPGSR